MLHWADFHDTRAFSKHICKEPLYRFYEIPTLFYYWYYVTDGGTDRRTNGRMDGRGARVRRPFLPCLIKITYTV
jgi:hypothetical protein